MSDEPDKKETAAITDQPQEEFIEPQAVPSQPERAKKNYNEEREEQ